jgi:hypothetical protein
MLMIEKLETCPHCGEVAGLGYYSQMCGNCDYGVLKRLSRAAEDVFAERQRQVKVEGWTIEHDDTHRHGQMATAAACYALWGAGGIVARATSPDLWPWDEMWWKPKDRRRDLVRAAALIIAEIERLDRDAEAREESE